MKIGTEAQAASDQRSPSLQELLQFERLLAELAAGFINLPASSIDGAITDALRHVVEALDVERSHLIRFAARGEAANVTHSWAVDGVLAVVPRSIVDDFPWAIRRLRAGDSVVVPRVDNVPPEAATDQATWQRAGVRSHLSIPMRVAGEVEGAIAFACLRHERAWPQGLVARLRVLADVFSSALARKRAQEQLEEAQADTAQFRERLAHIVRVHTMGEMFGALAHELNQPLMAIENYALAAQRRAADVETDPRKLDDLLRKVVAQATRAGDVVKRLRAMVKLHDSEMKEVDLARAIRECVEMIKVESGLRNVRIDLSLADQLPVVVVDQIQIQQVLLNLLRNALDAMEVLSPDREKAISVEAAVLTPEVVTVSVADRGIGVGDTDPEKFFEPFFSTKSTGLGIGLSISRKIIEAHGGTMRAQGNPGGGAVFQFTLPSATATRA